MWTARIQAVNAVQPLVQAEEDVLQFQDVPLSEVSEIGLAEFSAQVSKQADEEKSRTESLIPVTTTPKMPGFMASSNNSKDEAKDTSSIQHIKIPFLGVEANVVAMPFRDGTWDITGLKDNVAWLEGTSKPGLGSNTVLAGHITVLNIGNGPFRFLYKLSPGYKVVVETAENRYTYKVRELAVVNITDGHVTGATTGPQLTLVTCSNWSEEKESYQKRLVVFADLAKIDSLLDENMH